MLSEQICLIKKDKREGVELPPSLLALNVVYLPSPVVFPVIYQRSGKLPRKAAARNYNCIFPEPSPATARCFPVPLHRGYSRPTL